MRAQGHEHPAVPHRHPASRPARPARPARGLARTRWPDQLPGTGWDYGIPLDYVQELAGYWRTGYDWRAHEQTLTGFDQFTTTIDGQRVHFLHGRSPGGRPDEHSPLPESHSRSQPGNATEDERPADGRPAPAAVAGCSPPAPHTPPRSVASAAASALLVAASLHISGISRRRRS